ncbi:hypothetical protein CI109_107379 [Kwoniella shandongensis]|uniref:Protein phosphatase n=1 Tax=Kwoniella shandongensis TaxID=1734106 RepID=A0A5M6BVP3_9TREE|nr:uncharacterized protein CI109_004693 [Kwoniella shandongensis]KAA5526917.1 hypothetical protein CI109_004693 [Kwoniella shandongensis]
MSKPKPGLGKGIVRTLAVAQHPTSSSGALTLAPVVSQYGYSTSSSAAATSAGSGSGIGGSSKHHFPTTTAGYANGWPLSHLSLIPTWDQNDIVLSYNRHSGNSSSSSRLRTSLKSGNGPNHVHARRYSTTSISPSAFLTPSLPPSLFGFTSDRSPSHFYHPTPAQSSLDALLAALEMGSGNGTGRMEIPDPPPPSPSPPLPLTARSSHQQQAMKPRPSETHSVLSPAPLTTTDIGNNSTNSSVSFSSTHYLSLHTTSSTNHTASTDTNGDITTPAYSSSLIFHLGASGLPKERLPSPPPSRSRPPTPPRQRSFPLPEVTPPTQLRSISVGEDAYFTRLDGMCIADGVGGWARSGKGGADAGRWSRLLTHFCEEEVGDWWAGREVYLVSQKEKERTRRRTQDSGTAASSSSNGKEKEWAKEAWKKGKGEEGDGKERRPLDPVEIMQRGYEKCLACVTAEGIHGSSTCLLALLHHSTLHIANLGDCCLLLIRSGEVVFRTSEMQHAFNFPLQVGTHSRDEPMKDAMRFDVGVKKGDIVIVGSDGLMDNLFDEDILDTLAQFSSPSSSSSFPPFSPQHVSEALCRRARSVSELVTATTPFMCKAIEEGIDFVGGKKDDISVLVGVIGDRVISPSSSDQEGQGERGGLALHT